MEHAIGHLIAKYGYVGIIVVLSGGIVGLPIPDELLLSFIGFQVYLHHLNLVFAILSSCLGALIGISVSYLLGKRLGLPFLLKYGPRFHITNKRIEWTHTLFEKYGKTIIVVGYFLPGVRHLTGYLAGISRLPYQSFFTNAFVGAFLWCFTFIYIGKSLGKDWHLIEQVMHHPLVIGSLLLIAAIIAIIAIIKIRRNKSDG